MRKHLEAPESDKQCTETLQRLQGGRGEEGARRGMTGLSLMSCLVLLFSCFQKNASCCPPQRHTTATPWRRIEEFVILGSELL